MKSLVALFLAAACTLPSAAQALSGKYTTESDALMIAKNRLPEGDYDFYITESGNSKNWCVLADAAPDTPWGHSCYTCNVPKLLDLNGTGIQIVHLNYPPEISSYKPIEVKNRLGGAAYTKPRIAKYQTTDPAKIDAAQRTYAVIIDGTPCPIYNSERYWNNCSLVYQTLAHRFGVPKANIYPLISDGTFGGLDMHALDGNMKSQPLDLDFDGNPEISLAATSQNIKNTLVSLVSKLGEDDHLLVYITGFGERGEIDNISYLPLGNDDFFTDDDLVECLAPFSAKYVNIDVVVDVNAARGFVEKAGALNGCVAMSSTGGEYKLQQFCVDQPYTRFTYDWACAMSGLNPYGASIPSDFDDNGHRTVLEAYRYASARVANSEPAYKSTPASVGEDLAFDHLAPAVDLYIKDNWADTGVEPNPNKIFWNSPSIWVRNENDGKKGFQQPFYSLSHEFAWAYVTIHNRGKKAFVKPANTKDYLYLHLFASQMATAYTAEAWCGQEADDDGYVTGYEVPNAKPIINTINPGDSITMWFTWNLSPDLSIADPETTINIYYSLLAKIDNNYRTTSIDSRLESKLVGRYNKIAQKSLTVLNGDALRKSLDVIIRNSGIEKSDVSIELRPHAIQDRDLFNVADVGMIMSKKIADGWKAGGYSCKGASRLPSNDGAKFFSHDNKLENISLGAKEFDKVSMNFRFHTVPVGVESYTVDLIQRDADGNIMGGETFVIKAPQAAAASLNISESSADNGRRALSADMDGLASVYWKDSYGETIAEGATLTVLPTPDNNTFKAIALNADGDLAVSEYTIDTVQGISAVSAENGQVTVQLLDAAPAGASICIGSATDTGSIISADVPEGAKSLTISAPQLTTGVHAVTMNVDDEKIDSKKFVKQY